MPLRRRNMNHVESIYTHVRALTAPTFKDSPLVRFHRFSESFSLLDERKPAARRCASKDLIINVICSIFTWYIVTITSAWLGDAFPDGWFRITMNPAPVATMTGRRTSRRWNRVSLRIPTLTRFHPAGVSRLVVRRPPDVPCAGRTKVGSQSTHP